MTEQKSLFDVQLELLQYELKAIDGAIRQHDEITKSVKNWAVVTWTASIGFTLGSSDLHPFIWLTAIVPLVFWLVDGSFRRIQRSFIVRLGSIREYVNSGAFVSTVSTGGPLDFPLLVMRKKGGAFKDGLLGTMWFRSVWLLYVGLAACSITAALYQRFFS